MLFSTKALSMSMANPHHEPQAAAEQANLYSQPHALKKPFRDRQDERHNRAPEWRGIADVDTFGDGSGDSVGDLFGVAHRTPFSNALVIGVSTKPGLMVMTSTPDPWSRFRSPCKKMVTAPFAEP